MPLYPYADVNRRLVPTSGAPLFTPGMENARPDVEYPQGPMESPDPIRQSDFWNVGKAPGHTAARVPVVTAFNLDSTLAIEAEEFGVQNWARPNWTGTPPRAGGMAPWTERTNVGVPAAIAYGSLFSLPGVG